MIDSFVAAFAEIAGPTAELRDEYVDDPEQLTLWEFAANVLVPQVVRPLLTYRLAHRPQLAQLFSIVEELLDEPTAYVKDWLDLEILEIALIENEPRAREYMGPRTTGAFERFKSNYPGLHPPG